MTRGIARVGDTSDHGGTILTGAASVLVNGARVARIGDLHSCPRKGHGTTAIVATPLTTVTAEGAQVACVGAVTGCGATIVTGSPDTNTNS